MPAFRNRIAATLAVAVLGTLAAAGVGAQTATATPIASAATNWDGVTLHLMSAERKGNVLTLKWALENTSASSVSVFFSLAGNATTYVVDEENGTKYYVLADKEGNSLASEHIWIGGSDHGISDSVDAKKTNRYWAKFPAPPPEVTTITVLFSETEPVEGVTITDK